MAEYRLVKIPGYRYIYDIEELKHGWFKSYWKKIDVVSGTDIKQAEERAKEIIQDKYVQCIRYFTLDDA